jgi:hypothetical protein
MEEQIKTLINCASVLIGLKLATHFLVEARATLLLAYLAYCKTTPERLTPFLPYLRNAAPPNIAPEIAFGITALKHITDVESTTETRKKQKGILKSSE